MARLFKAFALLAVTAILVPVATAGTVLASFLFLPLPAALPEPRHEIDAQISKVYDINGQQIGAFRRFEITQPVTWEDIVANPYLKNAVLAGEDRRFYEHGGIDVRSTLRAIWADIRNAEAVQGGSTITQQYVKNAYVGKERSLSRKIREAILASQLDRQQSKDEILFRYLDQVYLGEGAYGVGAAAQTYFHKSVRDLTLSEAATIAGLIPAPSYYDPRRNPQGAELKRVLILKRMLDAGFIDQGAHDAALPEHVVFVAAGDPPPPPVTVVYPREEERYRYPYFMDYVRRHLDKYGQDAVYTRGLQIYTTLDPKLQQAAEDEVAKTLNGAPPAVEMALASVEPGSGYVKALVGGRDFYAPGGQNNLALGGKSGAFKQPGSAVKPFVLTAALEAGISPNRTYSGRNHFCLTSGKDPYCPENYGGTNYGTMTLREALKHSVNTIFAQLIKDVGVEPTMALAKRIGLRSYDYKPGFHGYSVSLGAQETNPLDMASAYGVWAARGERADPTPIVRVLDSEGHTLEDNTEPTTRRVLKEEVADTVNSILQGPLQPGGTAAGKGIDRPAAGKTGTTQDNRSAWFVGYTPQLSTAVWMGHRDDDEPMGAVKGVRGVTGGTWPARTWQAFMKRALDGREVVEFSEPAPITAVLDDAKRRARKGFDIGTRRNPVPADDGGNLQRELPPPSVDPPTTSTTTTTTELDFGRGRRPGEGPGNGNGGL
jgi:penicillin-binding protein 1A